MCSGCFALCSDGESLTSIEVSDGVTKIGNFAFASCIGLTNITIPENVTEIGENAFLESSLTKINGKKGSYANVNLNNAKILLKGVVGIITLTNEQKKIADMNNDGQINLNDSKMLLY